MQNKDISMKKKFVLVDLAKVELALRDTQQGEGSDEIVSHIIRLRIT